MSFKNKFLGTALVLIMGTAVISMQVLGGTWPWQERNTQVDLKTPVVRHVLLFEAKDGREATVDFGGDAITYSGELSVDESAKIFFNALFEYRIECASEFK